MKFIRDSNFIKSAEVIILIVLIYTLSLIIMCISYSVIPSMAVFNSKIELKGGAPQGLANDSHVLRASCSLPPVFVNKVLLEQSLAHMAALCYKGRIEWL